MKMCKHKWMIEGTRTWSVFEPVEFWTTFDQIPTSDFFEFSFIPKAQFRFALKSHVNSVLTVCLLCDGEIEVEDFEFFLWVKQNDLICGSKERPIEVHRGLNFRRYSNDLIQMFCKVVTKKCHFCAPVGCLETNSLSQTTTLAVEGDPSLDSKILWKLQKENKLTDFCLKASETRIMVHRNVLAIRSKFFARWFEENPEKREYSLENTSSEAAKSLVDFVYLGQTLNSDRLSEEQFEKIYELSVRFSISRLHRHFLEVIKRQLSMNNAADLLVLAVGNDDKQLIEMVVEFAEKSGGKGELLLSDLFMELLTKDLKFYKKIVECLRSRQ
ncbi:Protein roadkill, protein [Aphelenchoides besseyi]|nr:Protein roadkill, protein [Aphelenchoides besseyi]KAI6198526.1 Protein roadkill, protein [Aphelenchoides besseyi]